MRTEELEISNLPQATVIISVYRNTDNLRCILESLDYQSHRNFEVLVSEDGAAPEIASLIESFRSRAAFQLRHLTQPDQGFRKNRALNSAIKRADADYLIFIDGDCVPHSRFIESHTTESSEKLICTGRRVELGPKMSQKLIDSPSRIRQLSTTLGYITATPFLLFDAVKNPESGFYSRVLHGFVRHRPLSIVGCNFSCYKKALIDINGFNEEYEAPGIGEDSDIEWRLIRAGYAIKNVKFLTPIFHLWHPRSYCLSRHNQEIYLRTQAEDQWLTIRGLTR